ncbi:hypothetical protein E3P92_01531 [Wallemia ichthyophaga]|uniref:Profilin n=2 Tax=Wallemia ichthyophaga TaxID=245174 RepID=A0A4T0HDF3_WALIC|nr:Profilin-1B [Wallemia ichthyophaga EXF-994]TIA73607.1 hypothetical protein E3P91_01363 [Wallemia ichthyophaga]EOR01361.1 Profilin-1B [Wallemia ichthyophaga EXF-994]TIA82413.1 hypothetical protein E3P98_01383 [Wallemia ichthyophaga]TIA91844.1 hypothetical protein E3P97_01771 [Wallemia ichthyophaga]TIB00937.1 hypothetical protein E3P95_01479 [Wallemia ichthyophaga]
MSWQQYVDGNLVGTQKVSRAAIMGVNGGIWAISAGYQLTPEEQRAIIGSFSNSEATQASGIKLNGQKFFTLQADEGKVYGKKGPNGCVIVRTVQAILVTEYDAPVLPGEATKVVEELADYLRSLNF